MEFLASSIIGGIIYDLVKKGVSLSVDNIFGNIYSFNNNNDSVYYEFVEDINKIKDDSVKIRYVNQILNEDNKYTYAFEKDMYKTNFAKRLEYALNLINESEYYNKQLNIEKLGEMLGLKSVNEIKVFYTKEEEPDYNFIELVSKKLGLNVEWMKYGHGNIFESNLEYLHNAYEIRMLDSFKKSKEIMFVIKDVKYRKEIGIICKYDDFNYSYYPYKYPFHNHVGGGGSSQLLSLYKFLRFLQDEWMLPPGAYKISEDKFNNLFTGNIYPGSVRKEPNSYQTFILDDFIALYNSEIKKEEYLDMYGEEFVGCQTIIKDLKKKIETN